MVLIRDIIPIVLGEGLTTRSAERRCEPGFYCQNGVKALCLSGYWGGIYGLSIPTCSGQCQAGYYCPEGSISKIEKVCGDADKYCPEGSPFPLMTSSGYYSIGKILIYIYLYICIQL